VARCRRIQNAQRVNRVLKAFRVGILPASRINRALGTELDAAEVWVSKACHAHIATDHAEDYKLIIDNIGDVISDPTWAGQVHRHGTNFYVVRLVRNLEGERLVLVAIGLEVSTHCNYNVRSAYTIKHEIIDRRRLLGTVKFVMPE
jgi:hypothetical protein